MYTYLVKHECAPSWEVCDPQCCPDSWYKVYASDPEEAAEKFCEQDDISSAEYSYIRNGCAETILVRRAEGMEIFKLFVEAESVPTYHARRMK